MDIDLHIFSLLETIVFILIIVFATIYSIPIICIRRFHRFNNIFTLNVSIATIFCCLSWLPVYAVFLSDNPYEFLEKINLVCTVAETIFTIQVSFSFVVTSIHRYCSLAYHTKVFFKRKQWIILCIGSQWLLGFVLSIPNLICLFTSCGMAVWPSIYIFGTNVVIPSILCLSINFLIYQHVRSSTLRVQPQVIVRNIQQPKISHRDIVLLRHMTLIFCVFIGGWFPIFMVPIIEHYVFVHRITSSCLTVWCELALLFDMIDLFVYNHELRKYFIGIFQRFVRF